jgi:ADP-heptose:LPS heptosyltransferase
MKVLVIQTASIGDVILITPILEAMHQHYPDSTIDLLVKKGMDSLFTGHPFLNQVLTWDKGQGKYRNLVSLIRKIRRSHYDHVITAQRFFSSGIIALLSGAGETTGFQKNPVSRWFTHRVPHLMGDENIHEVDRNIMLIKHLGVQGRFLPKLYPSPGAFAAASSAVQPPYVCFAPSSLWFTKQYPLIKWIGLLDEVPEHFACVLVGSTDDVELCREILNKTTHPRVISLAGKMSLLETAALMKGAVLNFTNDSAPMHLASAMDAPVTAIFCSTIPAFGFGPLSTVSNVAEVQEQLSCRPCGIHGRKSCPEGHFRCGMLITTNQLIAKLSN